MITKITWDVFCDDAGKLTISLQGGGCEADDITGVMTAVDDAAIDDETGGAMGKLMDDVVPDDIRSSIENELAEEGTVGKLRSKLSSLPASINHCYGRTSCLIMQDCTRCFLSS